MSDGDFLCTAHNKSDEPPKRKRGRPRVPYSQAEQARDLGCSQSTISRALTIATAVEKCPQLLTDPKTGRKRTGSEILRIWLRAKEYMREASRSE